MTDLKKERLHQERLPGTPGSKRIEEIENKAAEMKEHETDRLQSGEKETKARGELLTLMKKHKLDFYPLDDQHAVVVEHIEEKAFVRAIPKKKEPKKKAEKK